jgi:hypothetical protein
LNSRSYTLPLSTVILLSTGLHPLSTDIFRILPDQRKADTLLLFYIIHLLKQKVK